MFQDLYRTRVSGGLNESPEFRRSHAGPVKVLKSWLFVECNLK